jgi:hypothetical protein
MSERQRRAERARETRVRHKAYVLSLEQRVRALEEEIQTLQNREARNRAAARAKRSESSGHRDSKRIRGEQQQLLAELKTLEKTRDSEPEAEQKTKVLLERFMSSASKHHDKFSNFLSQFGESVGTILFLLFPDVLRS